VQISHFFLSPTLWSESLALTGDEARHCTQVTRHGVGDEVVIFDGAGRKTLARIEKASKDRVELLALSETLTPAPSAPLTLLQGIVKGDTMEWIIEKAVELGVQRIVPVLTQRSVVRLNAAEVSKKREKWQRVALEACKQSGQAWLPEIAVPCALDSAIQQTAAVEMKLIASLEPDADTLKREHRTSTVIAIGPEGDFTPDEYAQLKAAAWQPWSLGVLTLRSETAAICALSILGYEWRP
jgi:16S rRNA (uracil1498-N3)-methyltransferase